MKGSKRYVSPSYHQGNSVHFYALPSPTTLFENFPFQFFLIFTSLLLVLQNSSDLTSIISLTSILSQTKLITQTNNNTILTQCQICQAFAFKTAKCTCIKIALIWPENMPDICPQTLPVLRRKQLSEAF